MGPQFTTQLITIPTAAKTLSVSPRTLWRYIQRGEIATIKIGRGSTRVAEEDLKAYIEERRK